MLAAAGWDTLLPVESAQRYPQIELAEAGPGSRHRFPRPANPTPFANVTDGNCRASCPAALATDRRRNGLLVRQQGGGAGLRICAGCGFASNLSQSAAT
jgi:hypothetical protein